jgi:dihydroorotate dehydrogenase (fumarate)
VDTSTTYLGFKLPGPLMAGASPFADDLDMVKRLEDAGSSAIVMHSLFEEQLVGEELATENFIEGPSDSFAEAITYFPNPRNFRLGPDEYLGQIARIKAAVGIPVIASLNGMTPGGWLRFSALMAQAGADALELNVYFLATDLQEAGVFLEERTLEMIRTVRSAVTIPVAVKVSPFYTSFAHFARALDETGVEGIVLFNRFYQPDINVDDLEVQRKLRLSDSSELPLRVQWLAILSGRVRASLAVTGGVHTGLDAVKAILSGAHAVQLVSSLLQKGPQHLAAVYRDLVLWMEQHEYDSLGQMQGSMNLMRCPDPKAYERANYLHILKSWNM